MTPDRATEAIGDDDFLIHEWFGLSYTTHLVLPRVLLQSMPDEWQFRFVAVMREYERATAGVEQPRGYIVKAAYERECWELTDAEMDLARVMPCHDEDGNVLEDGMFYDEDGTELERWQRVWVPTRDPLPPYSRGRTRVALGATDG